jgi:hypothetical protein
MRRGACRAREEASPSSEKTRYEKAVAVLERWETSREN